MFCPVGYVTIAELWKEFVAKYELQLAALARKKYSESPADLLQEFGSPMDFCEDFFLQSLGEMTIFAADDKGMVLKLVSNLDGGRSQLFRKASVFESTLTARDPDEAGADNYWLIKMGSSTFSRWPHTMGPAVRHQRPWNSLA